jgi:hypothetical protein
VHSASYVVVMAWITASWWYILSTPSVGGGGSALRGVAAMTMVWPSMWLWKEPLPWPELGWRCGPPLGPSPPRAHALIIAARVAGPSGCSLVDEPTLSLLYLMHSVGLLSVGSRSVLLPKSVLVLKGQVGVRSLWEHPWWDRHHGLSGRSVF